MCEITYTYGVKPRDPKTITFYILSLATMLLLIVKLLTGNNMSDYVFIAVLAFISIVTALAIIIEKLDKRG